VRAAGVVLWEALTGAPLFHAESEGATMYRVLQGCSIPPSHVRQGVPPELDAIVMRALSTRPDDRFDTALEMAEALDEVFPDDAPWSHEIAAWLTSIATDQLRREWTVRESLLGPTRARANADDVHRAPILSLSERVSRSERFYSIEA
jgi:serine/threonine-protein kinase